MQPCIDIKKEQSEIVILDICFGLGFNVLTTLYYLDSLHVSPNVRIVSPEFDKELVSSLDTFIYPKIFDKYRHIIKAITQNGFYKDERITIEVVFGDARDYLSTCKEKFDIVYQDAFSPEENPLLWTQEYFSQISQCIKDDGILSTYSIALKIRLALFENGFELYLFKQEQTRDSTLASKKLSLESKNIILVNMKHKIACNPTIKSLNDSDVC